MPRNSRSRSPIHSSSYSNYQHSKESHNEKRSHLPEGGRDNNFNRTKRIRTSRSHSRSYSPKRKKSKSKGKHKKHQKHHSSSKGDDYRTDTTNSTNTSKNSSRYDYHKSKSKKKKHKKRKKHKKHEEEDEEELRLIQEIREWQQNLRMKKDPAKISSSTTIQHHQEEEDEEIEKKPKRSIMIPQTQKEYEAEQSVIREVVDPIDGRVRLIKGSGEVIERIVSREQHKRINKQATMGDALTYQKKWMRDAS